MLCVLAGRILQVQDGRVPNQYAGNQHRLKRTRCELEPIISSVVGVDFGPGKARCCPEARRQRKMFENG